MEIVSRPRVSDKSTSLLVNRSMVLFNMGTLLVDEGNPTNNQEIKDFHK